MARIADAPAGRRPAVSEASSRVAPLPNGVRTTRTALGLAAPLNELGRRRRRHVPGHQERSAQRTRDRRPGAGRRTVPTDHGDQSRSECSAPRSRRSTRSWTPPTRSGRTVVMTGRRWPARTAMVLPSAVAAFGIARLRRPVRRRRGQPACERAGHVRRLSHGDGRGRRGRCRGPRRDADLGRRDPEVGHRRARGQSSTARRRSAADASDDGAVQATVTVLDRPPGLFDPHGPPIDPELLQLERSIYELRRVGDAVCDLYWQQVVPEGQPDRRRGRPCRQSSVSWATASGPSRSSGPGSRPRRRSRSSESPCVHGPVDDHRVADPHLREQPLRCRRSRGCSRSRARRRSSRPAAKSDE